MAKIQGSNGLWYEGVVKDGRIWTARGNTGVAPYSPPPKKTLLPYASEADKAYAAAHPEQYNLPGAAGVPSSLVGIQAPERYVKGSGIPPEVSGSPSSLAPMGRILTEEEKANFNQIQRGQGGIGAAVVTGSGGGGGVPPETIGEPASLATSGRLAPVGDMVRSLADQLKMAIDSWVGGGQEKGGAGKGLRAPTPPGPPQPQPPPPQGEGASALAQLAQEILRLGGGGTLAGALANNAGSLLGGAVGGIAQGAAGLAGGGQRETAKQAEKAIPLEPSLNRWDRLYPVLDANGNPTGQYYRIGPSSARVPGIPDFYQRERLVQVAPGVWATVTPASAYAYMLSQTNLKPEGTGTYGGNANSSTTKGYGGGHGGSGGGSSQYAFQLGLINWRI